jgi:hypothetical protein
MDYGIVFREDPIIRMIDWIFLTGAFGDAVGVRKRQVWPPRGCSGGLPAACERSASRYGQLEPEAVQSTGMVKPLRAWTLLPESVEVTDGTSWPMTPAF